MRSDKYVDAIESADVFILVYHLLAYAILFSLPYLALSDKTLN